MGKLLSKSKSREGRESNRSSKYAITGATMQEPSLRQYSPIHSDAVTCVAGVKPGVCVSASKDQSVIVYNYNTGQAIQKWQGHEKEVTKVVYGNISDSYFSASRDKTVQMWQSGNASPVNTFAGHELVVTGLTINPDNSTICTGSRDNSMKLWSVQTGQLITSNSISRNLISHVKWAPSADMIAQSGEDKEVRIFDSRNLQVIRTFPKKQYIQTWCDISADNNYCLTCSNGFGGQGCEATLWDIRTSQVIQEYKGHHETVCCCVFLPSQYGGNANLIATSSNDCTVRLWNQDTKECIDCLSLAGSGPLTSIAAQEDGLVVSSFNSGLQMIEIKSDPSSGLRLQVAASF